MLKILASTLTLVAVMALASLGVLTVAGIANADNPKYQVYSATWDPGNLVDGAGESLSVATVDQARLGDACAASLGVSTQGILLTCNVTATGTVILRLQNETAGALDLATSTARIYLFKRLF